MKKVFKFIFLAGLIVLIIFLIFSLKSIPNYSKKSGSEIVWKSDYEKYQQGYCLKENKILFDEEIFRRGIIQYLQKKFSVEMKVYWHNENADFTSSAKKPKYYFSKDMNFSEIKNVFAYKQHHEQNLKKIEQTFREISSTSSEIGTFFKVDLESMTAGFSYPFVEFTAFFECFELYSIKSFLLKIENGRNKKFLFQRNTIDISTGRLQEKNYFKKLFKHKNNLLKNWNMWTDNHPFRYGKDVWEIDNCGNVNLNVEKRYEELEPQIGQAG
ncbi:MAG TPA: hypothetical protein ENK66_06640 [Arcobacter sp.]|nr:hypothetical protein [Arcobacter sp.]